MKKHTKRVVGILKSVLEDNQELVEQGVDAEINIIAYTSRTTIPNIMRHDVEMMIAELESKCTHPDGMFTENFAPETCCPDDSIFPGNGSTVSIDCNDTCVHHLNHKE